jgi:glutamate formiminotransferase/formiminotetrahydrofolate cyclodeaminase
MVSITAQTIAQFTDDLASDNPSPGGGSAAAVSGVLAASLVKMVAGLTIGRKKYAEVRDEMEAIAAETEQLSSQLSGLADRDARAYDGVMEAYRLPKSTDEETRLRQSAIAEALRHAAEVPLETAHAASRVLALAVVVAEKGNVNAVTDAGVGALLAFAAFQAASYNVRINISSLDPRPAWAIDMEQEIATLAARNSELATQAQNKVLSGV